MKASILVGLTFASSFVAPVSALAQAEVVGAIAGAIAAQQMTSDAESRRLADLVSAAPAYERHGLCAKARAHLAGYLLQTGANARLAEVYKARCPGE